MNVRVKLFARARDLAGTGDVELELPAGASIRDLRAALCERFPDLQPLAANLLIAMGNDYANNDAPVDPSAELACFPPVSGG